MSVLTLGISLAIAAVLAVVIGRVVMGIIRALLVVAAVVLLLSVWQRGQLPWCGAKPLLKLPNTEHFCPAQPRLLND